MKYFIILILCCFCLSLTSFLSACETKTGVDPSKTPESGVNSQNETEYISKEIADAVIAAYFADDMPEMNYYYSGAPKNGENYIDPERIGILINKIPGIVEEFDYLEDFALYVPAGLSIFEISVLKIKNGEEDKTDAVKAVLEKRMNRVDRGELMNYAPGEIPIFENMKVMTANNYAILLATPDNEKAEKIINGMLNNTLQNSGGNFVLSEPENIENSGESKLFVSSDQIVNVQSEINIDFDLLDLEFPESSENQNVSAQKTTPTPAVTVRMYSQNTMCFIGGTCAPGAKIKVTGGTEEFFTDSDDGNFFIEVPFAETGVSVLKLTAVAEGELPSAETVFIVKPKKDVTLFEDGGLYGNVIGYNSYYFCADSLTSFEGGDLLKNNEIQALVTRTEKKIQDLRKKGCDTEIIYLLIPNPMRIYAEHAPARYTMNKGETLRTQWAGALREAGATVIDLTDLFTEHKNDEFKTFQRTDTHWSEYGAMLGYNALMSYIGQKFPDALPRPGTDFELSYKEFYFGDMYSRFYLRPSDLKEKTAVVKFNFDPPGGRVDLYENGNCLNLVHSKVSKSQTTKTNLTGNFPSVYIYRDSFAGPLHDFLTDRFSTAAFEDMWNYNWKLNEIAKINPDYVLYIINERNIVNVMYN